MTKDVQTMEIVEPEQKKGARMTNIELLRILSMFLIVCHHYAVHGASSGGIKTLTADGFVLQALSLGGKLGVNCFVLITGYFSTGIKEIKWRSAAKLFIETSLFSLVINGLGMINGVIDFSVYKLIKYALPINFNEWWFATTYFVLLLLIPFLNAAINNISRKLHLQIIVTFFVLWSCFITFNFGTFDATNLTWFIYLYIVAAYIKKYPSKIYDSAKYMAITVVATASFILVSVAVLDLVRENYPKVFDEFKYYWDFTQFKAPTFFSKTRTIPTVVLSVSLFCLFKNLKIKQSQRINEIAGAMFYVYLIHDSTYGRRLAWKEFFKVKEYVKSPYSTVYALSVVVIVFVFCTLIGYAYSLTIRRGVDALVNKCANKFTKNKKSV